MLTMVLGASRLRLARVVSSRLRLVQVTQASSQATVGLFTFDLAWTLYGVPAYVLGRAL